MEKVYSCKSHFDHDDEAVEYLHGFVFDDCEYEQEHVNYGDMYHVETYMGVELWYNFVGNYYVFIEYASGLC